VTDDVRTRVLEATVATFGRVGIAKSTVEEVAAEAGLSRATIYRWFPGGRDQLVVDAIAHEVARFFDGLAVDLADTPELGPWLERFLLHARQTLAEHEVFQKVVETEPERLLPHLSAAGPIVLAMITSSLLPIVRSAELRPGVDPAEASEWLGRMTLSFLTGDGGWPLGDAVALHQMVRQLLAGVLVPDPGG
jgi:AcrR family transcriptional regulator